MYKNILGSTLPLAIAVILTLIVGNYGISRILDLRSQISQAASDKATLTEKLNTLRAINTTAEAGSAVTAAVLPDKNPAITVLSQLRGLAEENALVITKLKSGAGSGNSNSSELSGVDINFDASGSLPGIIAFLDGIQKFAPLSSVSKIKINANSGQVTATTTIHSFFAGFPKTIPNVTQQINDLTADEKATLQAVSNLSLPQFVEITPEENSGRVDPFNQ